MNRCRALLADLAFKVPYKSCVPADSAFNLLRCWMRRSSYLFFFFSLSPPFFYADHRALSTTTNL